MIQMCQYTESTIDSEGFKGGTRGAPIMPRDAVSRTANVERLLNVERLYITVSHNFLSPKLLQISLSRAKISPTYHKCLYFYPRDITKYHET